MIARPKRAAARDCRRHKGLIPYACFFIRGRLFLFQSLNEIAQPPNVHVLPPSEVVKQLVP